MRNYIKLIETLNQNSNIMYFLRDTKSPEDDLQRNFSCYTTAWCKTEDQALEDQKYNKDHLMPPKQDPKTELWCSNPEMGLSSFAFKDEQTFSRALMYISYYNESNIDKIAVFSSNTYNLHSGADGEDCFQDGNFIGWLSRDATWVEVCSLIGADQH